ncbi:MAG: DMT family transporter [Deltaproteobacteria bacterium]|nr:DMT family transporter [Deltaproteobacteria bacterium]
MNDQRKVHLALTVVSVMFGLSYILTKLIINEVPPQAWAFYRVVIAAATLLPFILDRRILPAFKLPRLWLSGFFGIVLNQLLFAEGLKRTTPSHSSLINACIPAITLVLSIAAARETWNPRRTTGIAIAIIGVLVLIGRPQGGQLFGDLLTLANVLSFSIFFVISQPLARKYPALALTGVYLLEGVLLLGLNLGLHSAFDPAATLVHSLLKAPLATHALMIGVAIQSTTVTYTLNTWALGRATPSQVAAYVTLQPVVATLLSAAFFHERLGWAFVPAFVMITGGVFLSSLRWRRTKAAQAAAAHS